MTINLHDDAPAGRFVQSARDERAPARDGRRRAISQGGADEAPRGRARVPPAAYAGVALFFVALDTVNALSVMHDAHGHATVWKPFVGEYSSAATTLVLLPIMAFLLNIAPPMRGKWIRFFVVHGPGSVAYSLIHVVGFIGLRKLVYAAFGQDYRFGPVTDFFYEYRKDLLAYVIILTFFSLVARRAANQASIAAPLQAAAPDEVTFDIRTGPNVIRARVCDIVTVQAAGNYVEFRLMDNRRPLMRTTLANVETALARHGHVRTHRSWLVNSSRVRGLTAEGGSGDFRLELDGGVEAPLSRRFPDALDQLRPRS